MYNSDGYTKLKWHRRVLPMYKISMHPLNLFLLILERNNPNDELSRNYQSVQGGEQHKFSLQ